MLNCLQNCVIKVELKYKTKGSTDKIKLTMVHEAAVAEPDTQHHSILSSGTVSLGNRINDAHSQSDTKPLYTFSFKTHGSTAGPMSSGGLSQETRRCARQHVSLNVSFTPNSTDKGKIRTCSFLSMNIKVELLPAAAASQQVCSQEPQI